MKACLFPPPPADHPRGGSCWPLARPILRGGAGAVVPAGCWNKTPRCTAPRRLSPGLRPRPRPRGKPLPGGGGPHFSFQGLYWPRHFNILHSKCSGQGCRYHHKGRCYHHSESGCRAHISMTRRDISPPSETSSATPQQHLKKCPSSNYSPTWPSRMARHRPHMRAVFGWGGQRNTATNRQTRQSPAPGINEQKP
jgi:hypothetical protein